MSVRIPANKLMLHVTIRVSLMTMTSRSSLLQTL